MGEGGRAVRGVEAVGQQAGNKHAELAKVQRDCSLSIFESTYTSGNLRRMILRDAVKLVGVHHFGVQVLSQIKQS